MIAADLRKVLDHLRHVLAQPDDADQGDDQLLGRVVAGRDDHAFAALVARHGPMVLGVCRRLLRHTQDAEDAFQATFLILARRAAAIRRRTSVGSWLYRVAYRTAQEARAVNARRRARETLVGELPQASVSATEPRDWGPLLDQEVQRLPEKYRAAIVLCDLESQPHKSAARQLGIPEGTLSSRLATARRTLGRRLAQRGLTVSTGLIGVILGTAEAPACVPGALKVATVGAAMRIVAGQTAAVTSAVAILMKGVLRDMLFTKVKSALAMLLVAATFTTGGLVYHAAGQTPATPGNNFPLVNKREDHKPLSEVEALRRENDLLRINLEVVLEKVRAQEAELQKLRGHKGGGQYGQPEPFAPYKEEKPTDRQFTPDYPTLKGPQPGADKVAERDDARARVKESNLSPSALARQPLEKAEDAMHLLRNARSQDERERAIKDLEKAIQSLRPKADDVKVPK